MMAVYCENHMKHNSTQCGHNAEVPNAKLRTFNVVHGHVNDPFSSTDFLWRKLLRTEKVKNTIVAKGDSNACTKSYYLSL
jgi:hypothetical protein